MNSSRKAGVTKRRIDPNGPKPWVAWCIREGKILAEPFATWGQAMEYANELALEMREGS